MKKKTPPKKYDPQPMQPLVEATDGTVRSIRFRENAIIRYIVDHAGEVVHPGAPTIDPDTGRRYHQGALDLGKLMMLDFPQEDREQFAQLMGYSVVGYHELSYVSDESAMQASLLVEQLKPGATVGCRDNGCPIHGGPLFTDTGLPMSAKRRERT